MGGGVEGNHRLTATTGFVLLMLLAIEGFTVLSVRAMLPIHAFVGVLLLPPIGLKLASTGYRFLRYYTGNRAYRAAGPPQILLRLLAPILVGLTGILFGSGMILLVLGPAAHDPWLFLHKVSFFLWFCVMSIHVLAYAWRLPALAGADLIALVSPRQRLPGVFARESLVVGSLVLGFILAIALIPFDASWAHDFGGFHGDH